MVFLVSISTIKFIVDLHFSKHRCKVQCIYSCYSMSIEVDSLIHQSRLRIQKVD